MADIVVTLGIARGGLPHLHEKIEALEDQYSSWDSKKIPDHFSDEDKTFICCEGYVRGYFTVLDILEEGMYQNVKAILKSTLDMLESVGLPEEGTKRIVFSEWYPIKLIEMTGFQGVRDRKFKYEVTW